MLSRKYYAQRGNNYLNNPNSLGLSYLRINNLKNKYVGIPKDFTRVPDFTQGEYIHEKRVKQVICNGETRVEPEPKTCANNSGKYCDVTKDLYTNTQTTYIDSLLPGKCVLNQPKKPMAINIKC
jgi:hypothetical protein